MDRSTTIPHSPWATHAMRGFESHYEANKHATANAPGSSYGIVKIDGTWEWYYPQYEIEGDLLDTLKIGTMLRLGQFKRIRLVIDTLRDKLNDTEFILKELT